MGKYVATQEQFDALEYVTGVYPNNVILNIHENGWKNDSLNALNGLSQYSLAVALLVGYEVEVTYKVGDWVIFDGKVCKVVTVCRNSVDTDFIGSNGYKQNFSIKRIRHATPEEIKQEKERRLWKSIGREPGEMKIGDAYEHLSGPIYPMDKEERFVKVKHLMDSGYLRGFYPAESFVSFKDGDNS